MGPVREILAEQNVVTSGEEEDERGHDVREVARPIQHEGDDFAPPGRVPCVGLAGLVVDRC